MNDITIIGGGTAGWLSAAFLAFHNPQLKITIVESPNIPTIGVGEGTFPTTMYLLNTIGINPKDLLVKSNGGFKLGIQYIDFAEKPFWLSVETAREWERFGSELIKNVSLMNKCPMLDKNDFFATHFVASDLAVLLKEHATKHGVQFISADVTQVSITNNQCSEITLNNGQRIQSKWFLDCTGFARLLISQTDSKFKSYSNELLVDSAVVGQTQYKHPVREFNPFSQITARPAGWQFRIPTYTRIGNGYVFSSQYTTPEEAEQVLKDSTGVVVTKHLKMSLGYYDDLITGNIVAVGLSGGFIEPMEATAIHLTERTLIAFNEMLNNNRTAEEQNQRLRDKIKYIKTLILGHYAFSQRKDPFWSAASEAAKGTSEIKDFLSGLKNGQYPTAADTLDVAYPYCQWNDLLRGFNQPHYYPDINMKSKQEIYMATYYLPNHYEYITELRKRND